MTPNPPLNELSLHWPSLGLIECPAKSHLQIHLLIHDKNFPTCYGAA